MMRDNDQLTADIAGFGSADAAVEWAHRSMRAKNTLTAEDAGAVEAAFGDRMRIVQSDRVAMGPSPSDPVVAAPLQSMPSPW